jgi:hypothetical protein
LLLSETLEPTPEGEQDIEKIFLSPPSRADMENFDEMRQELTPTVE